MASVVYAEALDTTTVWCIVLSPREITSVEFAFKGNLGGAGFKVWGTETSTIQATLMGWMSMLNKYTVSIDLIVG